MTATMTRLQCPECQRTFTEPVWGSNVRRGAGWDEEECDAECPHCGHWVDEAGDFETVRMTWEEIEQEEIAHDTD